MLDPFHESGTENSPEYECLHKEFYQTVGAECIGLMRSHVNKTTVRYERESDCPCGELFPLGCTQECAGWLKVRPV